MEIGRGRTQIRWKGHCMYIFYSSHLYFPPPHRHLFLKPYASFKNAETFWDNCYDWYPAQDLAKVSLWQEFLTLYPVKGLLCKFHLCMKLSACERATRMEAEELKKKKSQPSGEEKLPNKVRPQLRLSLPEAESMTSISVNEILARLFLSREQWPQETLGSRSDHTHRTSCRPRACSPTTRWQSQSPRSRRAGSPRRRAGPRCSPHRCRRRRHCRCRWCCHCLSSPCSGSSGCPAGSASPPSARPAGCYCDGMRLARVPRSQFWGLCKRHTSWLPASAKKCAVTPSSFPHLLHNQTKRVTALTAPGLT